MHSSARIETATLGDYGTIIRRKWRLVVLGVLVGLALAVGYLALTPKTWTATATVNVLPIDLPSASSTIANSRNVTGSSVNLDTEAQLVKAAAVNDAVARQISSIPIDELPSHVSVTVPANSSLLKISFSATGTASSAPAIARDGANAYADAYMTVRNNTATQQINNQIATLNKQIGKWQNELATATGDQALLLRSQIRAYTDLVTQLSGTPVNGADMANQAITPTAPSSPNRTLVLASGLMLGLLLGLFLAWWAARRDGRVYNSYELPERLNRPVLGQIPGRKGATPALLPAQSRAGQAIARVRNVLLARLPDRKGTLTVAGASPGTGADHVAANLAAAFARADRDTILVVADPGSCAPAMLGAPVGPGLVEVLRHGVTPHAVLHTVGTVTGLRVLSPGQHLATEIDDLEGAGIDDLIGKLRSETDVLVILAPPTSSGAEAQILASESNGAVVVVELTRTERDQVEDAFAQFEAVGTTVPGAVSLLTTGNGPAALAVPPAPRRMNPVLPPAHSASAPPPPPSAPTSTAVHSEQSPTTGGPIVNPSTQTPSTSRRFPSSTI